MFLAAASSVRGDDGAESSMSWRQLLIVFILGGGCTMHHQSSYPFTTSISHVT